MTTGTSSRRGAGGAVRRLGVEGGLAIALILLCALGLVLVHVGAGAGEDTGGDAPRESALPQAALVCPGAQAGAGRILIGTDSGAAGAVRVGYSDAGESVDVAADALTEGPGGPEPFVVAAEGDLAPGLLAGRSTTGPVAATPCLPTLAEQWFTGVGAGATWSATLELVNPNPGPAVADVTVLSETGPVEVPALRGLTVEGRSSLRVPLGEAVPRADQLALHVQTIRGRLGMSIRNAFAEVGGGVDTEDWLPAQVEPATENLILGLAPGSGERRLVVANPGTDEVRAELRVVTPDSTFVPAGVEPVSVPPESSIQVHLQDVLQSEAAEGALGVQLTSSAPLTATLRQLAGEDLAFAVPVPQITARTAAVVPDGGQARLLLGGAADDASVAYVVRGLEGRELTRGTVELTPGTAREIRLPQGARRIAVQTDGATVRGALMVSGADGATVLPLHELVRTALLPHVEPGSS